MLRWPVRSALYIDFENLPLPPESIGNWMAWLEDGAFDASGRRRRFLQQRVYWNSHAERHRNLFEGRGFTSILIGKFSGLKNGADIRMAMDVVETTYTRPEIDEYILLTGDSDFVPVLDRLREKGKRSAIVATEHRPNIHTTYHLHADVLISARRLSTEAPQYRRPKRGFLARLLLPPDSTQPRPRPAPAAGKAVTAAAKTANAPALPPALPPKPPVAPVGANRAHPGIDGALVRVVELLSRQPRNYVAQKRVLAELDQVPGFKRQGADAYLGLGGYRALMRELARHDDRITVVGQPGGGTGVVFMPPPATPGPAEKPANAATGGNGATAANVANGPPAPREAASAAPGPAVPLAIRPQPKPEIPAPEMRVAVAQHELPTPRPSTSVAEARET